MAGNNKAPQPAYEIKHDDNTAVFERDILKENAARLPYLTRLFAYVFGSAKAMCGVFLGLAVFLSLLQPALAFIWGKYIDAANARAGAIDVTFPQMLSLAGLATLYWLIGFAERLLNRYLYGGEDIERLSKVQDHRLQEKFRAKLYQKIARLYPDYMEAPKINDIIKRSFDAMGSEWSSLQRGVIIEGYVIIAKIVSVLAVAASLYIYHPILCLIVLAAPLPTLYTTYVGNKLTFKFTRDHSKILREARYYQNVMLDLSAIEVKALNLHDFFYHKWKTLADEYLRKEKKNQFNVFLLNTASSFISNIVTLAANVFAIILLTRGELSVGALGAVLALNGTLMHSTGRLFSAIANFLSKKHEAAQFFEFIDLNEQPTGAEDAPDPLSIEKLEARKVSYRYPFTDIYRIKNVDFTIRRGEKVAFVGENGAGKTTFIKLLTGMLQPAAGEILINGEAAGDISFASRYRALSYVFQEPNRFKSFTVGDNVFLGDIGAARDEGKIAEALTFSGFAAADKEALLGKDIGGIDLSGGEWQKIAIGRAYYRERDFIILDEPTSNLDPFTEADIFRRYIEMSRDKTVIMVTHRISVAALADRVVVFKDGRIVEDGRHEELLAKGGEYARLYSTQARWYDR
jgi:ATP-binding cassette subfamily B protein